MVITSKETFIDPFTDFAFKKLFGPGSSKARLIDFLNAILMLEKKIVDISYLNNEQLGITEFDRKSVFDIFCMDQDGNVFIIEIQRGNQKFFKDRSIFYSMFPIRSQAKKGDWNFELKKVYTICFLDFCFDDTHHDEMIHDVKLVNIKTGEVFCDRLAYLYIEMPKFRKNEKELVTRQDKWLYALTNMVHLSEIPLTLSDDPIFKELFMDAETAKLMESQLEAYYASKKAKWDDYARQETAMEIGLEKGMKKGMEQGMKKGVQQGKSVATIEIARKLKFNNIPLETIIASTGLSAIEIEKL